MKRLAVALAFAATACAPSVIASNSAGGMVRIRGMLNGEAKGMKVAEAECQKSGKVARYEGTNEIRGTLRYSCVAP